MCTLALSKVAVVTKIDAAPMSFLWEAADNSVSSYGKTITYNFVQGIVSFQYFKMGGNLNHRAHFYYQEGSVVLIPPLLLKEVLGNGEVV